MKILASLCCLAVAASPTVAAPVRHAPRSELNSKHHRLRVQVGSISGGVSSLTSTVTDELSRFAVGADITVSIPSFIGTGHGPFTDVYAELVAPKPRARDGLTITKTDEPQTFAVRCTRAGVFELAIDFVGLDGKPKADSIDIGCIAPVRFTATVLPDPDPKATQYLAGASFVGASLAWYGNRDGHEVQLLGALPVEVPDGSPLAVVSQGESLLLEALRPATSPTIISVGQRVTLPVEIVDPKTWTLDVTVTTKKMMAWIRARAFDAKGQPFAGVSKCELTSQSGAVATSRSNRCGMATSVRRIAEWKADRVCATLLGKRACTTP